MGNEIGKRGESIFSTIISRYIHPDGFLLDPTFLGDKFPTVDFYIHLLAFANIKGFFFASVKTTTTGYNADQSKLKVVVDKTEITELSKYRVPVYLFGIDEKAETGYFICANSLTITENLNGIPTLFQVNAGNLRLLWQEVSDYWNNQKEMTKFVSHFNM